MDICGSVQSQNVDFRFNEIKSNCVLSSFSRVRPCAILWTMWPARLLCPLGFSRQEFWSELPCMHSSRGPSPPRDRTRVSYVSCMAGSFFTTRAAWKVHRPHPHHPLKKAARKKKWNPRFLFLMNIPKFLKVRR